METEKNVRRFTGFADIYDGVRPSQPRHMTKLIENYLGRKPDRVVDLGCGTGLSTVIWQSVCGDVIGIDPSPDMIARAKEKETEGLRFELGYGNDTRLADSSADAVICSMSFHWMEPESTLREVQRILKPGGVFAAIDYDWPPVTKWEAEAAYMKLYNIIRKAEKEDAAVSGSFTRYDKSGHLSNLKKCGYFRYVREVLFSNEESCTAEKFISILRSQGSFRTVMELHPELLTGLWDEYERTIRSLFDGEFTIEYCYRMRIGVK